MKKPLCTCQSCPQCIGLSNYAASLMRRRPDPNRLILAINAYHNTVVNLEAAFNQAENYATAAQIAKDNGSEKAHKSLMEKSESIIDEMNGAKDAAERNVINALRFNFNEN